MNFSKCVLLLALSNLCFSASEEFVTLNKGDVFVLNVMDVERVAIGDEKIIQYKPLENGELLIIAGDQGVSGMHVWMKGDREKNYQVRVIDVDVSTKLSSARRLVKNVDGLSVEAIDNKLVFSGTVAMKDMILANNIVTYFPGALSIVKSTLFDKEPIIRLDVKILEVNKRAASDLGVDWQKSINGPSFAVHKAFDPSITGGAYMADPLSGEYLKKFIDGWPSSDSNFYSFGNFTSAFTSRINLLAENGDAQILASPKLSVKSGQAADFLSGGEYPIPSRDELGRIVVVFKEYGIKLKVTPIIDNNGVIDTDVFTEVSSIDFANKILDVPGVTTRNTKTRVNLNNGETLVISGLAYAEIATNNSKVPKLGDLPYIGRLFSKTAKNDGSRELVISITPVVITPESKINQDMLKARDEMKKAFNPSNFNGALLE